MNAPQTISTPRVAEHREKFPSDFQLEQERRPRGVLTAASWNRWKSIEELDLDEASTASEPMSGEDALPSETLSVRSRISSF